jgi:hypothetical protein
MTDCEICKRRVTGDPVDCKRCGGKFCVLHATSISQLHWLCDNCDAAVDEAISVGRELDDDAGDDDTETLKEGE